MNIYKYLIKHIYYISEKLLPWRGKQPFQQLLLFHWHIATHYLH